MNYSNQDSQIYSILLSFLAVNLLKETPLGGSGS